MTDEEKEKITKVLITADSGCPNCVHDIAERMAEAFPDEGWYERVLAAFDD